MSKGYLSDGYEFLEIYTLYMTIESQNTERPCSWLRKRLQEEVEMYSDVGNGAFLAVRVEKIRTKVRLATFDYYLEKFGLDLNTPLKDFANKLREVLDGGIDELEKNL